MGRLIDMGYCCYCKECGVKLYSVGAVEFGTNNFCEKCADELNLNALMEYAEETYQIDYCSPDENFELFKQQIADFDKYNDMQYQELKTRRLK